MCSAKNKKARKPEKKLRRRLENENSDGKNMHGCKEKKQTGPSVISYFVVFGFREREYKFNSTGFSEAPLTAQHIFLRGFCFFFHTTLRFSNLDWEQNAAFHFLLVSLTLYMPHD
jgi:hypothetical protein